MGRDTFSDTWVATDALGRTVPGNATVGSPRTNKFVGIFYFLWCDQVRPGPYDCTKIIAQGMQSGNTNYATYNWGPQSAFHYWGEPYYGYYLSHDPYVLRRHAQMLTDAGVDVLVFDVTNALTYENVYLALCQMLMDMRATGRTTPQIAFITHSSSSNTVTKLYNNFYTKAAYQQYQPLWFQWQGKPLILSATNDLSAPIRNFFTFRESWAWSSGGWFGTGQNKWPWLDNYPQNYGWHTNPASPEEMSVCIAQHPTSNKGRSSLTQIEPPIDNYFLPTNRALMNYGLCVTQQWSRALAVDPQFIYLTGWNEWIAQRFVKTNNSGSFCGRPLKTGDTYFVDAFTQEYNRDIEPMRGGHGDNYYYQMVEYLRRFKGARPLPESSAPKGIAMNLDFTQWQDVAPEYLDDLGDPAQRSYGGMGTGLSYTNTTGRNDLDAMKVARDYTQLYCYARTASPLTDPLTSSNWMALLLNTDSNPTNGWAGYDYLINRVITNGAGGLRGRVERSLGGWNWQTVGEVPLVTSGNQLHLAVPRSLLGLDPSNGLMTVDFKWADNLSNSGDPMEFMDRGDVAPNNRFNYRFKELVAAAPGNHPPELAAVSNQTVLATATLTVTNVATDSDTPAQTLTFSLLNAPTNATINPASGLFIWKPLIAQSPLITQVRVKVADDGIPPLSATQSFWVTVNQPATPTLGSPVWQGNQFQFSVNGAPGIWYGIWSSSNLLNWSQIGLTRPGSTPFTFTDPSPPASDQRYYKVQIGP